MPTHIEISDETTALLESIRREDESFDELLVRLADETHSLEAGIWEDTEKPEQARTAVDRLRSDFER